MRTSSIDGNRPFRPIRKAVKYATTAAIGTGAVLYMAKTGKLNPKEGGNKVLESVKAALKKPADKILTKVEPYLKKIKPTLKNPKKVAEKASELFANITKGISTLFDKIESKFNPEKFM